MKKLNSILRQHTETVLRLGKGIRLAGTVTSLVLLITLIRLDTDALLIGLSMALLALTWQTAIGAWKPSEDRVWMIVFALWYVLLYSGIALLF